MNIIFVHRVIVFLRTARNVNIQWLAQMIFVGSLKVKSKYESSYLNFMNIETAYPEAYRLARRFHELYEQSAPLFNYKTKKPTKNFIPDSPNGRLMAWVCYEIVQEELDKQKEEIKVKLLASGHGGGNWRRIIEQL